MKGVFETPSCRPQGHTGTIGFKHNSVTYQLGSSYKVDAKKYYYSINIILEISFQLSHSCLQSCQPSGQILGSFDFTKMWMSQVIESPHPHTSLMDSCHLLCKSLGQMLQEVMNNPMMILYLMGQRHVVVMPS